MSAYPIASSAVSPAVSVPIEILRKRKYAAQKSTRHVTGRANVVVVYAGLGDLFTFFPAAAAACFRRKKEMWDVGVSRWVRDCSDIC